MIMLSYENFCSLYNIKEMGKKKNNETFLTKREKKIFFYRWTFPYRSLVIESEEIFMEKP